MNVSNLNLFDLFSTVSVDDIDSISPLETAGETSNELFSNAFMEKFQEMQALVGNKDYGQGEVAASELMGSKLQTFADLLGNRLPKGFELEKNIDLENTLSALEKVLSSISEPNTQALEIDIRKQLETISAQVKELVDSVNSEIPQDIVELQNQIKTLTSEFGSLKERVKDYERDIVSEHNGIEHQLNGAIDSVKSDSEVPRQWVDEDSSQLIADQFGENAADGITNQVETHNLFSRADDLNKSVEDNNVSLVSVNQTEAQQNSAQLLETNDQVADLRSQIETLSADIKALKQSFVDNKRLLENHRDLEAKSVLNEIDAPLNPELLETGGLTSSIVESDVSHGVKAVVQNPELQGVVKNNTAAKQSFVTDKQANLQLNVDVESEADSQLNYENEFSQLIKDFKAEEQGVDDSVLLANKVKSDWVLEKSGHRLAADIGIMNRVMTSEQRIEVAPMSKHFAHPEWNTEMGERIIWMHKQNIPSAELRLNPEHLGPVKIKIDVKQDQANISFSTQHAVVKEAIEAALPKLREMFTAQQLNLADVNVSHQESGQRQTRDFNESGSGTFKQENTGHETFSDSKEEKEQPTHLAEEIEAGRAVASQGILNLFA